MQREGMGVMADEGFRVTVEDLKTGEKQCMIVAEGDFMLIPFAPCYLAGSQRWPKSGTVQVTLKDYRPARPHQVVDLDGE